MLLRKSIDSFVVFQIEAVVLPKLGAFEITEPTNKIRPALNCCHCNFLKQV